MAPTVVVDYLFIIVRKTTRVDGDRASSKKQQRPNNNKACKTFRTYHISCLNGITVIRQSNIDLHTLFDAILVGLSPAD